MSVKNFVQCGLVTPVATNTTELVLVAPTASYQYPPLDGGTLVIADSVARPTFYEVISYTHRIDSVLYGVVRGKESTAARAWTGAVWVYQALTAQDYLDALALKAPLASAALTGVPTAPTAAPGTNTNQIATMAALQAAIAALIESSPGALDTLNELAAALGDDPNFASTMTTALAGKEPSIAAGTAAQLWLGNKTWATVLSQVHAVLLTGLGAGSNSTILASDTLIAALAKIQNQLNNKAAFTDSRLSDDREWTATVVTQVEAEAGTATTARKWTAQRVWQAVLASSLTGLNLTVSSAVVAADTVLVAIGKLQKQINDAASNLAGNVRATVLTGYIEGTNAVLASADSVLTAFGKVQAQLNAKLAKSGDKMTGHLANELVAGFSGAMSIRNPDGGYYQESGAALTGTIKITLPKSWSNTMLKIRLSIYDYASATGACEIILGGYTPTANSAWFNTSAQTIGRHVFGYTVRFAHDGTNCCILLGTTGTVSHYPKIQIEEVQASYSGLDDGWLSGWSISRITSEVGITVSSTARYDYNSKVELLQWQNYGLNHVIFDASSGLAPDGSAVSNTDPTYDWSALHPVLMGWNGSNTYSVRVGSAKKADQLKTARTINGEPFDGTANITVADATKLPLSGGTISKIGQVGFGTAALNINSTGVAGQNAVLGFATAGGGAAIVLNDGVNGLSIETTSPGTPANLKVGTLYASGDIQPISGVAFDAPTLGSSWSRGLVYKNGAVTLGGIGGLGTSSALSNVHMAIGSQPWVSGNGIRVRATDTQVEGPVILTNSTKICPQSTADRQAGMYGVYDPAKIGHCWSMGTSYAIPADGSTFGNLYGIAYKHTNNPTGGTMAGGHQMVFCSAGTPGSAIGLAGGIWTSGDITAVGDVIASDMTVANEITIEGTGANWVGLGMDPAKAYSLRIHSPNISYTYIGCRNTSYTHYESGTGSHYFYGALTCQGNITAYSDIRVKANIEIIDNALEKVCQLNGSTFDRTDVDMPRQTGLIAQDVVKVLPEAIHTDPETGHMHVAYGNMVGLLVEAIKELKAEVNELRAEVAELRAL